MTPSQEEDRSRLLQRGVRESQSIWRTGSAIAGLEDGGHHEPKSEDGLYRLGVTPA